MQSGFDLDRGGWHWAMRVRPGAPYRAEDLRSGKYLCHLALLWTVGVGPGTRPDRTEDLKSITTPTLVIHGAKDTLVQVDGGKATAAAIKNSRLVIFDEMGHEMPEILWCDITTEILNHLQASNGT